MPIVAPEVNIDMLKYALLDASEFFWFGGTSLLIFNEIYNLIALAIREMLHIRPFDHHDAL